MKLFICLAVLALPLSNALSAYGEGFSSQGEVTLEFRQFQNDDNTQTVDNAVALFTRVDSEYKKGRFEAVLSGYGRVDQKDESRSFASFEDFYGAYRFGEMETFKALAGYKVFNWTALEAFHPADIVNARNYDSNLENLEKKGELTVELQTVIGEGTLNLYYFPRFQRPEFPESSSRYSGGVNLSRPVIANEDELDNDYWTPQYGVRFTQYLFDADISLHYLNRIDRYFPVIGYGNYQRVPSPPSPTSIVPDNANMITPYYFRSKQVGGTVQRPFGGTLFKLEWAYRDFDPEREILDVSSVSEGAPELLMPQDHTDVALGLEHQFHLSGGGDLTLLLEGRSLFGIDEVERRRMALFQRDVLGGFRYAFNDVMGKEIYFISIWDIENEGEVLFNTNYQQRLSDFWKLKIGLKWFEGNSDNHYRTTGLEGFDEDEHVFFNLTRYF